MTLQGLKTAAAHCAAFRSLAACAANTFYVAGLRQQLDSGSEAGMTVVCGDPEGGSLDRSPVQAPDAMTEYDIVCSMIFALQD